MKFFSSICSFTNHFYLYLDTLLGASAGTSPQILLTLLIATYFIISFNIVKHLDWTSIWDSWPVQWAPWPFLWNFYTLDWLLFFHDQSPKPGRRKNTDLVVQVSRSSIKRQNSEKETELGFYYLDFLNNFRQGSLQRLVEILIICTSQLSFELFFKLSFLFDKKTIIL